MSCCGAPMQQEEMDAVGKVVSEKLAAFVKTLRGNAFAVGLAEARDAAALMAAGYAEKPALLREAFKHLFSAARPNGTVSTVCSTPSGWENGCARALPFPDRRIDSPIPH